MNMLFLGLAFDPVEEGSLLRDSKIGLQNATNNFQIKLIRGLKQVGVNLMSVSSLPVASFPKFNRICIHGSETDLINKQLRLINLPLLKQLGRIAGEAKWLRSWAGQSTNNREVLIYHLYIPHLLAVAINKSRIPDLKVTAVVPDLVGRYGVLPKNRLRKSIRLLNGYFIDLLLKYVDRYVVLTDDMPKALGVENEPYIVLEGIASSTCVPRRFHFHSPVTAFYAGSLGFASNALGLVTQIHESDLANFRLVVCGSGTDEDRIKSISAKDDRIDYMGYLPLEDVERLREESDILINPRPNDEFAKYSFPSKTIDYLQAGKPTICCKLDGIPHDYDKYLFYSDSDQFVKTISEVIDMDECELADLSFEAANYLSHSKSEIAQASRVISFICSK